MPTLAPRKTPRAGALLGEVPIISDIFRRFVHCAASMFHATFRDAPLIASDGLEDWKLPKVEDAQRQG